MDIIGGNDHRGYVGFTRKPFREDRAHGAVNNTGRKRFFFAGFAFTFEKTARDFARSIGSFFIIDG